MKIEFTKMHGIGNDFVLIDCRNQEIGIGGPELSALSRRLCHRRFGIGADQILLLYNSTIADFRMRIFNADGSEVEMCGNGIRCLARYIWDRGLSDKAVLSVETAAGLIMPEKAGDMVRVDMGEPILEPEKIPVKITDDPRFTVPDSRIINYPLKIDDRLFEITCVSMGNPHAVIVVDDVNAFDVGRYGPRIENHEFFPRRVNVEFIEVVSPGEIRMRVWERGAGETLACGTGASAVGVAANLNKLTGRKVNVILPGGGLVIEWNDNNHVYMTGPAVEVFEGKVAI